MVEANPYVSPTSDVTHDAGEFGHPAVFSFKSRIGRLRYLARVSLFTLASYAVFGALVAAAIGADADGSGAEIIAIYAALFVASIVFAVMFATQRLHDLNRSGWMSLLLFVPLVNLFMGLYLLFTGGTEGQNEYGLAPPPNTLGIKLAAIILPLLFILGVVAAVSIPAYQDYATRAQEAQLQLD
jgi:uncharacterized membrane protein YhaH (DUF805 family)